MRNEEITEFAKELENSQSILFSRADVTKALAIIDQLRNSHEDLLAACKALLTDCKFYNTETARKISRSIAKAEQAIAKAEPKEK